MAVPVPHAAPRTPRAPPTLPFGWGAVTVLVVGAVLMIVGIVVILYGMIGFFTGTIGSALNDSFSIGSFFSSFFGSVTLFVVGGILTGAGGWLLRLWWIFLLVGAVSGIGSEANTVRGREAMRAGEVRVRCRACGRLNPEEARFCIACGQAV